MAKLGDDRARETPPDALEHVPTAHRRLQK